MRASSLDPAEIERFERLASTWWDPEGPMRALHAMNPARLSWIRREASRHFGLDPSERRIFAGHGVLDIGCGGGLLCEPLARLGAKVAGIDPAGENIRVAKAHAERFGLAIDYRACDASRNSSRRAKASISSSPWRWSSMWRMSRPSSAPARVCLKPGGLLLMSTLNRTLRSFALAIVGAEYVLRWLPRGTHDWEKFLTPEELARQMRRAGLKPGKAEGLLFDPLRWEWRSSRDTAVNYVLLARKPGAWAGSLVQDREP